MSNTALRWGMVVVAIVLSLFVLLPTFADLGDGKLDGSAPDNHPLSSLVQETTPQGTKVWRFSQPLTLGLDLQGGLLLQYHVYVERAVEERLERIARDLDQRLREKKEGIELKVTHPEGTRHVQVEFAQAADEVLLDDDMMSFFPQMTKVGDGAGSVRLEMAADFIEEAKGDAVTQAIETIRQRIDALGVAEPSITRQGQADIVVQLPGLKADDVERAKRLIGQTAQLRFQMVDDTGTNEFFNKFSGQLPDGFSLRVIDGGYRSITHREKKELETFFAGKVDAEHVIGYQHHPVYTDKERGILDEERSYWKTYYIAKKTELTGDYIQDARVAVDPQFNRPYVSMTFDAKGAELFGKTTTEYVGRRFAIMMDDVVNSAPVINEPITGGRAQITLGSMQSFNEIQQEAQDLVIALRHGALPAPIERQFETVVGPTLGQDSIDSAMNALMIGSLLVILFMVVYYRASGVIATMAVLVNVLVILASLAGIGATVTLPGIAGIILTVGMAVDANVVVYERIREELRGGASVREAVQAGFDKALSAVLDANITTGIAALVLLQYGTGPVRGFAVTLLIGILGTLFSAIFLTRLVFDHWLGSRKDIQTISI